MRPWFHAIDLKSATVLPLNSTSRSIGIVRDETAVFFKLRVQFSQFLAVFTVRVCAVQLGQW
jgi:hypothetical protein